MIIILCFILFSIGLGIIFSAWPIVFFRHLKWIETAGKIEFASLPHVTVEKATDEQWRLCASVNLEDSGSKKTISVFPASIDNIFSTQAQLELSVKDNLRQSKDATKKFFRHKIFFWIFFVWPVISKKARQHAAVHMILGLMTLVLSLALAVFWNILVIS